VGDSQVHDFEPGIAPSGLFWTVPVPKSAVEASPGAGNARFHLQSFAVDDYHDFFNAISPSPTSQPAIVSFDVRWTGARPKTKLHDTTFGFEGDFIAGTATIAFTAQDVGSNVVYTSDPAGQTTAGSGVGHERNGIFFH
jgi:hypothetical protein